MSAGVFGWVVTILAACPLQDMVAREMGSTPPSVYQVSLRGSKLAIQFRDEQNFISREFEAAPTCEENARVARAVLGAWLIAPRNVAQPEVRENPAQAPDLGKQREPVSAVEPAGASQPGTQKGRRKERSRLERGRRAQDAQREVLSSRLPLNQGNPNSEAQATDETKPIPEAAPIDASSLEPLSSVAGVLHSPSLRPEVTPSGAALSRATVAPLNSTISSRAVRTAPTAVEVSLALGVLTSPSSSPAPDIAARVGWGRRWGVFAELAGALPRFLALGGGQVSWTRIRVALGGRLLLPSEGPLFVEPALTVEGAGLVLSGLGFNNTTTLVVPDVGGCAHLRGGWRRTNWQAFVGARVCAWPVAPTARVMGTEDTVALPMAEAGLVLGGTWSWGL